MISVIMPFYKAGGYLNDALCSLEWQTFRDFEVILVDDGSDEQPIVGKRNFVYSILTEQHHGPAYARNSGIKVASGDLIFPFDCDDILIPTCLERLVSKLGQSDVVYCNYILFGTQHWLINSGEFEPNRLSSGNFIINSSLYKKRVWDNVRTKNGTGYDEQIPAWEDWLFWREALTTGARFAYQPEFLQLIRKTGNGRDSMAMQQRQQLLDYASKKLEK
jgi:glycosyltransferase involved in cell wall biosynthesis